VYFQKKHSLTQVIVGSVVGSIVGLFFYHFGTKSIPKKWKIKQDDNAPM
jgi:Na+/H+-dicarboxylate symporter